MGRHRIRGDVEPPAGRRRIPLIELFWQETQCQPAKAGPTSVSSARLLGFGESKPPLIVETQRVRRFLNLTI